MNLITDSQLVQKHLYKKHNGNALNHSLLNSQAMYILDKPLTNIELPTYARELKIPHFRGVYMQDTLPHHPYSVECSIVNLNTSNQAGSHWYAIIGTRTIEFILIRMVK